MKRHEKTVQPTVHVGTDPRLTEVGQIGIDNHLLEPAGGIQTRTTENVTWSRSISRTTGGGLGGGMGIGVLLNEWRGYAMSSLIYTCIQDGHLPGYNSTYRGYIPTFPFIRPYIG